MYSEETQRKVLAAMPATQEEISIRLKIAVSTARAIVKRLHLDGKCHIGGWKPGQNNRPCRIYHSGPGATAPHPAGAEPKHRTGVWRDPLVACLFGCAK